MYSSLKDIFNILTGKWKLTREIKNIGYAEGYAYFTIQNENIINYFEEVEVTYFSGNNSTSILNTKAIRSYIFNFNFAKNIIYQNFADNQLYTELKPIMSEDDVLKYCGNHLCNHDKYHNIYEFIDQNNFKVFNKVKGPSKDYIIETTYKKINR